MKAKTVIVSFSNGSLPPPYAYHYEIVFSEETTDAELKIFKGYDNEVVFAESKKFNLEIFQQLLLGLETIKEFKKNPNMVGGSHRSIEIKEENHSEKIIIDANDEAGISLFNRFLYVYSSDFLNIINKNINL